MVIILMLYRVWGRYSYCLTVASHVVAQATVAPAAGINRPSVSLSTVKSQK